MILTDTSLRVDFLRAEKSLQIFDSERHQIGAKRGPTKENFASAASSSAQTGITEATRGAKEDAAFRALFARFEKDVESGTAKITRILSRGRAHFVGRRC